MLMTLAYRFQLTPSVINERVNEDLDSLKTWLPANKLSVNVAKTHSLKGLCKVKSLHLQSRNSKNISFKSNLHTESTKDSVTIRFLSRHETMLCRSNVTTCSLFFVLFIEEPIYLCTSALIIGNRQKLKNIQQAMSVKPSLVISMIKDTKYCGYMLINI